MPPRWTAEDEARLCKERLAELLGAERGARPSDLGQWSALDLAEACERERDRGRLADLLEERAKRAARSSFLAHVVWCYTGHSSHYRVNWHHRILASYLERFATGESRRLLISMPPGTGKTEIAGRMLPGWIWLHHPHARIAAGAYSGTLASETSRDVQAVVSGDRYQALRPGFRLPTRAEMQSGQHKRNAFMWALAGSKGKYKASGIGGSITGFRGGYILIDDPVKNRAEAESEAFQRRLWKAFADDWSSRVEPPGCILVMATRWHDRDLIGQILAKSSETGEHWDVINIPAILDCDPMPGDPRSMGEPIWPEQFLDEDKPEPREALVERALAFYRYQMAATAGGWALYQGRPRNEEGELLKRKWTERRYARLPQGDAEWVLSLDMKGSASQDPRSSFSVAQCWMRPKGQAHCYLVDEERGRYGFDEAVGTEDNPGKIAKFILKYPQARLKYIEEKGYGPALRATLSRRIPGLVSVDPKGSKVQRLNAVLHLWQAGNVWLPAEKWADGWADEVCGFPGGFTDRVDAMTQALDPWKDGPARFYHEPARQARFATQESGVSRGRMAGM